MTLDELEKLCSHESYSVNDGTGKWATVSLIPGKMKALIACARLLEELMDDPGWYYPEFGREAEAALAAVYGDSKGVPDWECG